MVDVKGTLATVGEAFNLIFQFLGANFISFMLLALFGALLFFIYYRYILYNIRIRVIKPNNMEEIASAREFKEPISGEPRIKIKHYTQHDGSPPPINAYYLYRGSIKLYKGATAYQDVNGILHFVKTRTLENGEERIDVIDPVTIEQYLESRERSIRKYHKKDEKVLPIILTSLIIYTLVLTAGLGWGMYQFREASEQNQIGMTAISQAVTKLDTNIQENKVIEGQSADFQESQTIVNPFNPA